MLIRFNLGNFLSFSATEFGLSEEISMIADTKIKNKKRHIFDNDEIQLLKFAALYGKDITDTKNLVKAMRFMKDVILNGLHLIVRKSIVQIKQNQAILSWK